MVPKAQFLAADDDITDVFHVNTENPDDINTSQKSRLQDILDDLNNTDDDVNLSVYRQSPLGGKSSMVFLATFPPDKYTMDELQLWLRDNHGSGDYRVQIRSGGKLRANKLISVEAPQAESNTRRPTSEAGEVLSVVMQAMEKQNAMLASMMNQAPQQTEEDIMRKMVLYKELFSSTNNAPGNALTQLTETMGVLNSLGIEVGGQKEPEDSFVNLLEKMTPVFEAAVTSPAATPKPNPSERPMINIKLKIALETALRAASKGSDPEIYAQMLVDNLGAEKTAAFLSDSTIGEKLLKIAPKIANYSDWFDQLMEYAKAMVGMPSQYADLYVNEVGDINAENLSASNNDSENLSTTGDTQREGGDSANAGSDEDHREEVS